jgi:hypothetical protein
MSQVLSDNEPLKPQELGSTVKVKKLSQKQLFQAAAAKKAAEKANADWSKKYEEEKEAKAAERRRIEREEEEKEKERRERLLAAKPKVSVEFVAASNVNRKTLGDFLPLMPSEGDLTCTLPMQRDDFGGGEENQAEYNRLLNESRKKMSNYSARLNKMNSIDEANAKYMESMSKAFGYKQTATLGGKFAGKTR